MVSASNTCPVLQNRWKAEGKLLKYYGLRNYPYTLERIIKLTSSEVSFLNALDGKTTLEDLSHRYKFTKTIRKLLNESVIVDVNSVKRIPQSLSEAQYCIKCAANDFIIPGLEFDNSGKCALCQAAESVTGSLSTPLQTISERDLSEASIKNTKSRFDVALMYTGGKDSSYLLYYLAKVCKLRVLACTWTIPFMSPNAKANILAAKERLKNVEYIERYILPEDLDAMYKKNLELQGNTCLCPSLAYIIFYPLLAAEQIPYIISGVEEAQHKNLILNGFLPLNIYKLANSSLVHALVNLSRIFTLRTPYRKGQLATITYLKQLAFGNSITHRIFGYTNETLDHFNTVFNTVPDILKPFIKSIRKTDRSSTIPVMANIDFNSISPDGVYDWNSIKIVLAKELGWKGTGDGHNDKGLHTSCIVEDGKDYSQFMRFRNMESMMIPFSAIELSTAVSCGNITRDQALEELEKMPGFSLKQPAGYEIMLSCNGQPCGNVCGVYTK